MTTTRDELRNFICPETGSEHRIGQAYDERRGVGNGPQICLSCRKTLSSLITAHDTAKRAEIEKALPKKKQREFYEKHLGSNEEDWQRFYRYGGYDFAIDQFKEAIDKVYNGD